MSVELKIKWDGVTPGLPEHRLSIGSFGLPLHNLLRSIRRTASNIVRDAIDMREASVGSFAFDAGRIDIEVHSLVTSCGGIQGVVKMQLPPQGTQIPLSFDDLTERATDRVLEDIEKESRGVLRNNSVRRYLDSLPPGITQQEYSLSVDGEEKRHVVFGSVSLPEPITELPYLAEVVGNVIGVGFEPGRNWVRVKGKDGDISVSAPAESVDRALEMRNSDVRLLYVFLPDGNRKLLRIDRSSATRSHLNVDEFVFKKWRSVLESLAQ